MIGNEYYKCTSREDRLEMIETIYQINPNFIHVVTYNDRHNHNVYDDFPFLAYSIHYETITGYGFTIDRYEITKEEFLDKLQKKIDGILYPINLKHKF